MNSRRKFLLGCSAFTVASVLAPVRVISESTTVPGNSVSADRLDYAAFSRQLDTPFQIHTPLGRKIDVRLAEVRLKEVRPSRPHRKPLPDADYEKFSIVFSGRRDELLEQNIYTLEHATLGRFDVFIVPILTRNPARIDYQTIFNRPRGGPSIVASSRAESTPQT